MNILFINSIGKNKWGGGEKWMLTAAEGLKNLGHSVTVSCRKNSIVYQNATLRNLSTIHIISNIDFDICKIKSLHRFCKENRINVIIGCLNKDIKNNHLLTAIFSRTTAIKLSMIMLPTTVIIKTTTNATQGLLTK